jgi:hypothetical protein
MLTVGQLLSVSLPVSSLSSPMRVRDLLPILKSRSLSMRTAINAVESSRVAYCVYLRSINLLLSPSVNSVADLQNLWNSGAATISEPEVSALYQDLKSSGIYLDVLPGQQTAVIIGAVGDLAAFPTIRINDQNLSAVKSAIAGIVAQSTVSSTGQSLQPLSGGVDAATGVGLFGGTLIAIAALPAEVPAVIIVAVFGAAFLVGVAAGYLVGTGINELRSEDSKGPTSSADDTQTEQPDGSDIATSDGTVYGDVEGVDDLQQLADSIVSVALTGLPDDFNSDGSSIPGLLGLSGGTDGGGDSGFTDGSGFDSGFG